MALGDCSGVKPKCCYISLKEKNRKVVDRMALSQGDRKTGKKKKTEMNKRRKRHRERTEESEGGGEGGGGRMSKK